MGLTIKRARKSKGLRNKDVSLIRRVKNALDDTEASARLHKAYNFEDAGLLQFAASRLSTKWYSSRIAGIAARDAGEIEGGPVTDEEIAREVLDAYTGASASNATTEVRYTADQIMAMLAAA
jgi:hypothetical protein